MAIKIEQKKHGAIPVLTISGRIAGANAIKISKKLESMKDLPVDKIVLDLSQIDYLDSTWLGTFIYSIGLFKDNGKNLIFLIPGGFIEQLFNTSNIAMIATVIHSLDEI